MGLSDLDGYNGKIEVPLRKLFDWLHRGLLIRPQHGRPS